MKPDMDKGEEQKENDREPMKMSGLSGCQCKLYISFTAH